MSILIICQKLSSDDDLLGAFVPWVRAIAKHVKHVDVVCLSKGEYHLPENCEVYSLGKEEGVSRVGRWINFIKLMFKLVPKCDVTFSHMSPIFSIVSWPFVKLFGKKASLWYAHGHVSWKIKLAEKCVDAIFTSTLEGCRISSDKIRVVGQGIDVERFKPLGQDTRYKIQDTKKIQIPIRQLADKSQTNDKCQMINDKFSMVSIGRIAPSKDYETMVKAAEILVKMGVTDFEIKVIGKANLAEHERYFDEIKKMAHDKGLDGQVKFLGVIPNNEVVRYYQEAVVYLNMSHTGSLDRAIVEAMACGCLVLTCNEAAEGPLRSIGLTKKLMYSKKDYKDLAEKIRWAIKLWSAQIISNNISNTSNELATIGQKLRQEVVENHSVSALGEKIVEVFDKLLKLS